MAVGDDATAAGFAIVPDTGDPGRVKLGAIEINRTRDYIAQVKATIPASMLAYQTAMGLSIGTAAPSGGVSGNIYLQTL
jgi:hypothetical protein